MRLSVLALCSLALLGSVSVSAQSSTSTSLSPAASNITATATTVTSGQSNPIVAQGSVLVDSVTGKRFFAHGVGYDYAVTDSQESNWRPSLEQLLKNAPLTNVLRIYVIDPTASHAKFMQWANSKGLYVIIPVTPASGPVLDEFGTPTLQPSARTCYPPGLLSFGQTLINQFAQYTNVLSFMVGNEVMRDETRWKAAPCVKGYARDLRAYMNSCQQMRVVPLMYADSDDATSQDSADANNRRKADYLTCGPPEERVDIYGINTFRWCNSECTYESCRWKDVHDAMSGVGIPVLLTEHGCDNYRYDPQGANIQGQREWKEMQTLLSNPMAQTFSGGIAYTFGVRGGTDFSMYNDGSVSEFGFPGLNKTCGYGAPGIIACNVDNYQKQLNQILANPLPTADSADSANRTATNPVCQPYLNYDMSMPPTRQGVSGYTPVSCPAAGSGKVPNNPGNPPVVDATTPGKTNMGSTSTASDASSSTDSTADTASSDNTSHSGDISSSINSSGVAATSDSSASANLSNSSDSTSSSSNDSSSVASSSTASSTTAPSASPENSAPSASNVVVQPNTVGTASSSSATALTTGLVSFVVGVTIAQLVMEL